jgi:hypothetical protein
VCVRSGTPFTITSRSDYNLDGILGNDRANFILGSMLGVPHPHRVAGVVEHGRVLRQALCAMTSKLKRSPS